MKTRLTDHGRLFWTLYDACIFGTIGLVVLRVLEVAPINTWAWWQVLSPILGNLALVLGSLFISVVAGLCKVLRSR